MAEDAFDIGNILRTSGKGYGLDLFTKKEIKQVKVFGRRGKPYLKCFATAKERPAKPEEIVRQLYLWKLIHKYGYPSERLFIEKPVYFGSAVHEKAADIVICDEGDPDSAYIIVECKKPKRRDGIEQLKSYCNAEGSPIGVWTNGGEIAFLHRQEPNVFRSLPGIPRIDQELADLLEERWDIGRLTVENKLIKERLTLKSIILDMENLVLANAGVDAFEDVFKLIYAKLYDEWSAQRHYRGKKYVEFRLYGSTPRQLYDRISTLFNKAKAEWPGVFLGDERIELEPAHLLTCVSFLEDIKLFNSNLQIIDEAFEYLAVQVGKGSKGQYFTPRYVIDMCVKMLNPKVDEFMIDTAAGSCGFTVHSIFHVCGNQFTAEKWERWQIEYAAHNVFGIDFDARSVKIAKALNLIAGDGRTNVYRANTLDSRHWPEDIRVALRPFLQRFPDDRGREDFNKKNFRYFNFDTLMTNPPFAGDIEDARILHQFELARKISGKWHNKMGRDILFIERNLEFLKPGGRMCIVLPQGRYNNTSDKYIREFIADKARILAVVGLHPNTFKPHTGTKTSVLFLQKWDDDLCQKKEDYPIFFAVSEKGGKDNSGDYIFVKNGHLIVDHDLHNQGGERPDGIAEAFVKFAKKEELSFWMDG
jgi:type I restriction enzyme M protein